MEEEKPTTPSQETQITLTIPHDMAVTIAAAALHYRAFITFETEMTPSIEQLDEVYQLIMQQPQLTSTSKAFLRNIRFMAVGLKDEGI